GASLARSERSLGPTRFAPRAAFLPDFRERDWNAKTRREIGNHLQLGFSVRRAPIDPDHARDAEVSHVLDVLLEVRQTALERTKVLRAEILLVGPAVQLE